jgi:hypothetical protein
MRLLKRAYRTDGSIMGGYRTFGATINTCGSHTASWETGEQAISKRNGFGVQLGILAE